MREDLVDIILIHPLYNRRIGGFKVVLELDIKDEDGISKATIEKVIKETISQLGAKITKEKQE